jgi:hypothetical protein
MKRWAAGLVVGVALLGLAAPAGAAVNLNDAKKACGPTSTTTSCKAFLYKNCVAAAKQQGLTSSEAARVCGG